MPNLVQTGQKTSKQSLDFKSIELLKRCKGKCLTPAINNSSSLRLLSWLKLSKKLRSWRLRPKSCLSRWGILCKLSRFRSKRASEMLNALSLKLRQLGRLVKTKEKMTLIWQRSWCTQREICRNWIKSTSKMCMRSSKQSKTPIWSSRHFATKLNRAIPQTNLRPKKLQLTRLTLCRVCCCELINKSDSLEKWTMTSRASMPKFVIWIDSSKCRQYPASTRLSLRRTNSSTCSLERLARSKIFSKRKDASFSVDSLSWRRQWRTSILSLSEQFWILLKRRLK